MVRPRCYDHPGRKGDGVLVPTSGGKDLCNAAVGTKRLVLHRSAERGGRRDGERKRTEQRSKNHASFLVVTPQE